MTTILDEKLGRLSAEDRKTIAFEKLSLDFAEAVAERLGQLGWSKLKLAERLNMAGPTLSKILRSRTNPTLRTISAIAYALGMDAVVTFQPAGQSLGTDCNSSSNDSSVSAASAGTARGCALHHACAQSRAVSAAMYFWKPPEVEHV